MSCAGDRACVFPVVQGEPYCVHHMRNLEIVTVSSAPISERKTAPPEVIPWHEWKARKESKVAAQEKVNGQQMASHFDDWRETEHVEDKQEKVMGMTSNIDWAAVQRDRDAGIPVSELEKKYGVSNPTIYTRTHGSKGPKPAGNGTAAKPAPKKSAAAAAGNGSTRAHTNGNGKASAVGRVTIEASAELLDMIWNGLPLPRKAALLSKLNEV